MNGQSVVKAFVPLPADATAVYVGSTLSYFRHPDWLGSSRFASTPARTMYSDLAYAPFGETYAEAGTADRSFTGQNQDTVPGPTAGLYDFLFREYAQYGRWVSPDPAGMAAVNPANPQSWNRYAYVLNNPTGLVDPLGLLCGPGSVALPEGGCGPAPDASSFWCSFFGLGCGSYPRVGPVYTVAEWDDIHGRGPHRPVVSQNPPTPQEPDQRKKQLAACQSTAYWNMSRRNVPATAKAVAGSVVLAGVIVAEVALFKNVGVLEALHTQAAAGAYALPGAWLWIAGQDQLLKSYNEYDRNMAQCNLESGYSDAP